nr:hypothetical protein [Tanacetum cinerariifolium]
MTKTKPRPNWLWSGGSKTDEGLPEDTFADERKSARQTHIRKSRLQADPCPTKVPLWPLTIISEILEKPSILLTYKRRSLTFQKGNHLIT